MNIIILLFVIFILCTLICVQCKESFIGDSAFYYAGSTQINRPTIKNIQIKKPYRTKNYYNKVKNRPYDYFDFHQFRNSYEYAIYGDNKETGEVAGCIMCLNPPN